MKLFLALSLALMMVLVLVPYGSAQIDDKPSDWITNPVIYTHPSIPARSPVPLDNKYPYPYLDHCPEGLEC